MLAPAELLSQALRLPADQRAEMAERLLESLPEEDDVPVVLDAELEEEILRRAEQHQLGQAKKVDFETFKRTLRQAASGSSES